MKNKFFKQEIVIDMKTHNTIKAKIKTKVVALITIVILLFPTSVFAVARPTADTVPIGTLIIGTHLIALRSMTPQIYEIAIKSAAEENQHSIYYRSEFADGKWCDITKAENIVSLTATSGKPVGNEVIDALVLTHYTMTNGKTYDLKTEVEVNVSDIISPYDTTANSSLKPLQTLANSLNAEGVGDKDTAKKDMANKVLKADYHTKQTDAIDKQIADMGAYINNLRDTKADEQIIKKAVELQEKIDNNRRIAVYTAMAQKTEEVINEAGKSTDEREAFNDLVSLLSDAQKKLNEDVQALNGKTMNDGTTVAEKQIHENEMKILNAVETNDYATANNAANALSDVDNINEKKVVNREKELKTASSMASKLENEYKDELAKGNSTALKKAMDSKNATEAKIESDKLSALLDEKRNALQDMISAVELRKSKAEKATYAKEIFIRATAMQSLIPKDYATSIAQENLNKYSAFALEMDSAAKAQMGIKSDAEKLADELFTIKEKTKEALDKNDIEQADLLKKSAEEVQKKIDKLNKETKEKIKTLQKQKDELDKKIDALKDKANDNTQDNAQEKAELKKLSEQKANIELEINQKVNTLADKALTDGTLNNQPDETATTSASLSGSLHNQKVVFDEVLIGNVEYVPISVIPSIMNLRLVIESKNTQILSNGGKYYTFSTGSETVKSEKGNIDVKGKVIRRSDKLFVTRKFVEEQLSLVYIKLPNAGKAALMSKVAYANMEVN